MAFSSGLSGLGFITVIHLRGNKSWGMKLKENGEREKNRP
jgi:hypothetical protein